MAGMLVARSDLLRTDVFSLSPDQGDVDRCSLCHGDVHPCLRWRFVADAQVASLAIVEDLDGLEERGSGLAPGGEPGSVHEFGFERAEEALHRCVVQAISLTAHGSLDAVEPEELLIIATSALDAAVGMMDQPSWWSPVSDRHGQRILAKGAFQTLWHRPADDLHRRPDP